MYLTNKTMKLINPIHLYSERKNIKVIYKNESAGIQSEIFVHT